MNYNFYLQYKKQIDESMPRIDYEIQQAKKDIESLIPNSELYVIANERYQWLLSRRISNRELSCNGIKTKTSLVAVSEALGSFETAKIMLDCESNLIGWNDIGYKDKNRTNPIFEIQKQAKALRRFTQ